MLAFLCLFLFFALLAGCAYLAIRRYFPKVFAPQGPSVVAATAAAPPADPEGKPGTGGLNGTT